MAAAATPAWRETVCAAYGLLAFATWVIGIALRRAARIRGSTALALASPATMDLLRESFTMAGTPQDPFALTAASRPGRERSAMQLLTLKLVVGFIATRRLGR
jgi:hypothetical protein